MDALVNTIDFSIEADAFQWIPLLHAHVDVELTYDYITGLESYPIFKATLPVVRIITFVIPAQRLCVGVNDFLLSHRLHALCFISRKALLSNERVELPSIKSVDQLAGFFKFRFGAHANLMYDRVFKHDKLLRVHNCLQVIVKDAISLLKNVENDTLVTLCHSVVIAVTVQVIATVKEFLHLKFVLLWIANLIVNDASAIDYDLVVKRAVLNIYLLRVTKQIVDFVNIDAIARI